MAYSALKAFVANLIYDNGINAITGNIHQGVLNGVIDELGKLRFKGVATPSTNPGSIDGYAIYFASEPGIYTNFSNLIVNNDEIAVLKYDDGWTKEQIYAYGDAIWNTPNYTDQSVTLAKLSQAVQDMLTAVGGGTITNNPDDEDLETIPGGSVIRFKDRNSNVANEVRGYKIIRQNFNFSAIPSGYDNSVWEIRYKHDLLNASLLLPSNVVLYFNGGMFTNYNSITGVRTKIIASSQKVFDGMGDLLGTWDIEKIQVEWFDIYDNSSNVSTKLSNLLSADIASPKRKIRFPKGTFNLTSEVTIPSNTIIEGVGKETEFTIDANSTNNHFSVLNNHTITFKDLLIKGNRDSFNIGTFSNYPNTKAITIENSNTIKFENVAFEEMLGTCIDHRNSNDFKVLNCSFKNIGLGKTDGSGYNYDMIFLGGTVTGSVNVIIDNCIFIDCGQTQAAQSGSNDADAIQLGGSGITKNVFITNNYFSQIDRRCVKIQDAEGLVINNNIADTSLSFVRFPVVDKAHNVTINGNTVRNIDLPFSFSGFTGQSTKHITISSNSVFDCLSFLKCSDQHFVKHLSVNSNTYEASINADSQEFIIIKCEYMHMSNNYFKFNTTAGYPVYISPGSSHVKINDNVFESITDRLGFIRCGASIDYFQCSENQFIEPNDMVFSQIIFVIDPGNSYDWGNRTQNIRNNYYNGRYKCLGHDRQENLPTSGVWLKGDKIYRFNVIAGVSEGWICITTGDFSGTPPVFKEFGSIAT